MNRQCRGRRKLVHLDAVMCAEMSNTVDGARSLREPMSVSVQDNKMSRGLLPRPSKPMKPCEHSSERSRSLVFSLDYVAGDLGDSGEYRQVAVTEVDNSAGACGNDRADPKYGDFVSARKFMNPTCNLLDNAAAQNNNIASLQPMRGNMSPVKPRQKRNGKRVVTPQKNSLDRYFKPVRATAQSVSATQSCDVSSAQHYEHCSNTPENSPYKYDLTSPVSKLSGYNNVCWPSPDKSSASCDSITSSQHSSSTGGMLKPESCHGPASKFGDDDDGLDFEADFDYIFRTCPEKKRKSTRQTSHDSKKKASSTPGVTKIDGKSSDAGRLQKDLTIVPVSENGNVVSSDFSAENFGLFGFSNNTLLQLDSDTDFEDDVADYFSILPPEVVSNILCRLPFTDLCVNVNRVCMSWKNIIDSDDVSYLM